MRPNDPRTPGNYFFASVGLFDGNVWGPYPAKLDKDGNVYIQWPQNVTEHALVETVWDRLAQEPNSAVALAQIRYQDHMMTCPGCTHCGFNREPSKYAGGIQMVARDANTVAPAPTGVVEIFHTVTGRTEGPRLDADGVDRSDAPEGYEARIETDACIGCAFYALGTWGTGCAKLGDRACTAYTRDDRRGVIFVKKV